MICCDICKKEAIYFFHVDYLRDKDLTTFDLCEEHNQKLTEFYCSMKEAKTPLIEDKSESQGRRKLAIPK